MAVTEFPGRRLAAGEAGEPMLTRSVLKRTGEARWLLTKAAMVQGDDGEALVVNIIEDVTRAQIAQLRERFLSEAGQALSSSLDYEETLQSVARLAVPQLADWCAVEMPDEWGGLQQVALAHVDPEKVALGQRMRERYPPRPDEVSRPAGRDPQRPQRALHRDPGRAARAVRARGGAAAADPRRRPALGDDRAHARRRAGARRDHVRLGRQRAALRRGRPGLRRGRRAPRRGGDRERAPVHRARADRRDAAGEPAARAAAGPARAGSSRPPTRRASAAATSAATSTTSSRSRAASWSCSATSPGAAWPPRR